MLSSKSPYALLSASILAASLGGCAASNDADKQSAVDAEIDQYRQMLKEERTKPEATNAQPKMENIDGFYADTKPRKREPGQWLRDIPFDLNMDNSGDAIPLREVLRIFGSKGINIATKMPMDDYYYSGPSIKGTNAYNAMRLLLSSMGVDYRINDDNKSIEVTTMPRKTYSISLNNREASYSSDGSGDLSDGDSSSGGSSSGGSSGGGRGGSGYQSGNSGSSGSSSDSSDSGGMGISANNNFWGSLEEELEARCTMLVPKYGDPVKSSKVESSNKKAGNLGWDDEELWDNKDERLVDALQGDTGSAQNNGEKSLQEQQICAYSLNASTGTVTVQGPRWMQDNMASYFDDLNATLNTSITLEAKILLYRDSDDSSEGVDLSAFAGSLADTGVAIRNNVLGGVTLGADGNQANVSASDSIANTFLGGRLGGAQAFIGWLEEQGSVSIENEPVITTVSGVPTTFKRTSPVVYFRYNQESTTVDSGAVAVSIESEEVERRVGSTININPTYDRKRNMVRAQLGVNQRYLTGYENDVSFLATGDSLKEVPVRVPLIEEIVLNGEILLNDGETVIVGGQQFQTTTSNESGVENLRDNTLLGGLFGSSTESAEEVTYYMVLTVSVDEEKNELDHRL